MSFKQVILESRSIEIIHGSVAFIENATIDSKILRGVFTILNAVYPQKIFDFLDTSNKKQHSLISKNIFSPVVIFPIIFALFISISSFRISNLTLLTVGIGLLLFYFGFRSANFTFSEIKLNDRTKEVSVFLLALGLIFLIIDLYFAGAIPLFSPSARTRLIVVYTMLAELIPPGAILLIAYFGERYRRGKLSLKTARIYSFSIFVAALILISTLGFRTQIIVTLLGGFIAMQLTGLVGFVEVILSLALAGFGVVFLGYLRAASQGSPIGFFEVIGARIGLTLSVFDHLVKRFMPFGANKGYTLLASFSSLIPGLPGPKFGPRTIVARLFGISGISVTSTLLGTIVLDLGIVGVVLFMFLLGHVLGTAYRAAKTGSAMAVGIYAVLLAYTIVGIETGLVDFNVLSMFIVGYLILRSSAAR